MIATAASPSPEPAGAEAPVLPQAEGVVGPYAAAEFPDGFPIHGVDGDTRLLFVVSPAAGTLRPPGVYVAQRQTGALLGPVPAPPVGWTTPLSLIVEDFSAMPSGGTQGTFLVLDAGGPPTQAGRVTTYLHRYQYEHSPPSHLEAAWVETHRLPAPPPVAGELPSGIMYTSGFALLPGGEVAVDDTIAGAIWVSDASREQWRLAALDPDFAASRGYVVHGIGRAPGGGTRPYTFQTPGDLYPGIHSLAYAERTDELCAVRTAPPGGIWCLARSVLLDPVLSPLGKPKRTVVAPRVGFSDGTDGLAYDRYHPTSPWLYWARAFSDDVGGGSNILRRVNLVDGRMEEVTRSLTLYDFTGNLAALPPLGSSQRTAIFSAVGQEENNPEVNVALEGLEQFVAPTPLPIVEVPFDD